MFDTAQTLKTNTPEYTPSIFASTGRNSDTRSTNILVDSTRIFCSISRPDREDISNYKAFFYQFVDKLPVSERRLISAMLSQYAYVPRPIALYLALDKVSVAAPFLLFSPVLTSMDLATIAKKKGTDHANIIARRRDSVESIVGGYNEEFLETVLEESVEDAIEEEVVETKQPLQAEIKTPIAADNESTEIKHIDDVLMVIPPKTQDAPEAQVFIEVAPPTEIKSSAASKKQEWLSSDEIVALASVGGKLGKKKQPAKPLLATALDEDTAHNNATQIAASSTPREVSALAASDVNALVKDARALEYLSFCKRVESLCGLNHERVRQIITSEKGDQLAYLIKALAVPAPKDLQLLLMLAPQSGRSFENYQESKALLNSLEIGICRMIFNEVGAKFEIPGAPEPTRISGVETPPDYTYSAKMRREHISAVSRVEQRTQTREDAFELGQVS
ncbi:MAG: hypothetical protein AB8B49_04750 [Nitratireductor sp.]